MINEKVFSFLKEKGYADRLTEHKETIDTVEHAAQQIGCSEAVIAKTLSFIVEGKPVIVVMAGDGRVNSSKFKALFHTKPSMIQREQVEAITGFAPGGVCPFNVPKEIPVWLDVSMKRFEYVHPAGGNSYTSVKLTPAELEEDFLRLVYQLAGHVFNCKLKALNAAEGAGKFLFKIVLIIGKLLNKLGADFFRFFDVGNKLDFSKGNYTFDIQRPLTFPFEALIHNTETCLTAFFDCVNFVAFFCAVKIKLAIAFIVKMAERDSIRVTVIAD